MAKYPVKLLKDKDGTAFIPVVNSDSIITPEGDTLNDLLEEKQDLLTSGTNIKTINNESLLGSGNISIQGGGDATDVQVNGVSITQNNVANIATQTAYNALTNKIATKNDIPTQTSQLTNNSGYITSSVDNLTNYTKTNDLSEVATSGSYEDLSDKPTIPSKMSDLTNDNNFVSDASYVHTDNNYTSTEKNKLSGIASGAEVNVQSNWTETNTSSDAYIKNKPTIPTVNNGKLTIQKNGTNVQTFTANQSSNVTANITVPTQVSELTNDSGYTTNTGTITKVQANGTDVASSGTANIPAATTSKYGVTKLSSATNSTSEALAATPKAVKAAYDLAASKGTGTVTSITLNATSPIAIDNSSAITTSGTRTISHANSGVTAGTYKSVTVDNKGHVTSGTNPTTLSGYGITDAKISNGTITLGSNTITPSTIKNIKDGSAFGSVRTSYSASEYSDYTMGQYAFSEGYNTKASGESSHAEGYNTTAGGNDSHAEGSNTTAGGNDSHAEGYQTRATNRSSHAEGLQTIASGKYSHAEGWSTIASGNYSHAEGGCEDGYLFLGTVVAIDTENQTYEVSGVPKVDDTLSDSAIYSGAIYSKTNYIDPECRIISAVRSSETDNVTFTVSSFDPSYIAVGDDFRLFAGSKASGSYSHAEGYGTYAIGFASHAEGEGTIASETGSHAGGYYTKAKSSYQTAVGKYNDNKNNTLFEVGNGTSTARSNAFEVYSDGRAIVGADPTTAMGVATKQYVDNAISLPQVIDSYSASTTDSYSCNYVNEINDKLLKTKNINLTINTDYVYSTDWDYTCIKIGNVVFLSINTIAFKVGNIPNDGSGVILSNLPKPSTDHIFLLSPRRANIDHFRVCINRNGQLVRHYAADPEYGDSANKQYGGTIIYLTND